MLGQTINKVGYERRLSVLSFLNDNKQAKKKVKDNQDEINKAFKFLFGEEFQKQLKTCAKAQESADKQLSRPGKRKRMTSNNRPYHRGSSSHATTRLTGEASSWSTSTRGRGGWKRGKGNYSSFTPKQGVSLCPTESKVGSLKTKKSFLKKLGDRNNPVRLRYFLKNWETISGDQTILMMAKGWKLPLKGDPLQWREKSDQIPMRELERIVVIEEIYSMIQKGVLKEVQSVKGQFISTIFVRPKKETNKFSNKPTINLKRLNAHMPYIHFKKEGMKNVSDLLNQGDYMVKIDLKDAYWHIHQESRIYLRFRWDQKLYEMGVLAFGGG